MAAIALLFFGKQLLGMMGVTSVPSWLETMQQNKGKVFIGIFLLNSVSSQLVATGAFEVTYNGQQVFSKLQANRMPSINELRASLNALGLEDVSSYTSFGASTM